MSELKQVTIRPVSQTPLPDAVLNIVFIHGLGGSGFSTWHPHNDAQNFWPAWIDSDLKRANVWYVDYPSTFTRLGKKGDRLRLNERAVSLLNLFKVDESKVCEKPYFIIAHSLGGLVAKQMLFEASKAGNNEIKENFQGIIFMGTPHLGSGLANISKIFGQRAPILKDIEKDNDNLSSLNDWFKSTVYDEVKRPAYSFYETKLTSNIEIVKKDSADLGVIKYQACPVDEDHITMCKYSDKTHPAYKHVLNILRNHYKGARHLSDDTIMALRGVVNNSMGRMLDCIKGYSQVHDKWEKVDRVLLPFNNEDETTTSMQLMSLIYPADWKRQAEWREYHNNIRKIAKKSVNGLARRLHLVARNDLNDMQSIKILLNLMISEYLCRIRVRVLCVDDNIIEIMKLANNEHGYYPDSRFTPFDAATITDQAGHYRIIFSNIKPYFLGGKSDDFEIYDFPEDGNFLFSTLRSNFYQAWHQFDMQRMFCLISLYTKAKSLGGGDLVNMTEIREFLGSAISSEDMPRKDDIVRILESFVAPANVRERVRVEVNLEAQLWSLC